MSDTIFALASARGKAGVSVFRISGPDAFLVAEKLCGPVPDGRGLRLLRTADVVLDQALVLTFQDGASFTGEPVVEFQCHGSPAVVASVSNALSAAGARLADPGEFTRRALENERLDLSQVEGLSDLIEAETEAQRKQAFALMDGGLTAKVDRWRSDLIRAAALIEATIDFADEDVPVDVTPEVSALIAGVSNDLAAEIKGSFVAERVREGFEVAIIGPPNIGKSTLLNALAGRQAAITSEIAGTTRDVIEVRMDLEGIPVTVLDTAGLRITDDTIEALGVELARKRAEGADLRIFLTLDGKTDGFGVEIQKDDLVLLGKADDGGGVSGKTGAGLDEMIAHITRVFGDRVALTQSAVRQRHRLAMDAAIGYITAAEDLMAMDGDSELVAMELNTALHAMNSIIGRVGVEDLLDEIFASFCLGK
ncbi:tRNA uridine-5-carboxymethylaminomethyl(34) synthesis GTPase MnmE [Amylibacter sp. IMCC11727]|uniref:tRNA uridine-5-carboxymethylaminomethyl(34) synthesis GTPase MnmE n=1 Tax=Amylibacter sp. IMCC11727 TaxID=3039851 RepID=UPI00244E0ADA|nr:tRNA uridine-5-carboxymethylaminomethyl(34) synthesis GTPase MnmE [Amylibacter sp. IMCC11727]WGI22055.1 tRNA uridine-5-carboxymethylaminomethyl(34) synthesis GTPase MnmE [Amylibacter sp. IMCC11727]